MIYNSGVAIYGARYLEGALFLTAISLALCSFFLASYYTFELHKTEVIDALKLDDYVVEGTLKLPKKIRRGSTHNISVDLKPVDKPDDPRDMPLTVELQAAGLTINGELNKKRIIKPKSSASYLWNCYFPNSGKHIINLIFKQSLTDSEMIEILVRTQDFTVIRLYRELWAPLLTLVIPTIPFWPQIVGYFLHH